MISTKNLLVRRHPPADFHLIDCDCPVCEPYAPSAPRFGNSLSITMIGLTAGTAVGVGFAKLYDMLMPGLNVGLSAVFGS